MPKAKKQPCSNAQKGKFSEKRQRLIYPGRYVVLCSQFDFLENIYPQGAIHLRRSNSGVSALDSYHAAVGKQNRGSGALGRNRYVMEYYL